jgi:hypothetical protein
MGIYGRRDVIVHPNQFQPLQAGVKHARIEILPRSGHFPMLDEPEKYLGLIRSFLEMAPNPAPPVPVAMAEVPSPPLPARGAGTESAPQPALPPRPEGAPLSEV